MNNVQLQSASESNEQICLFRWAEYASATIPELTLLFHIPNGGKRCKATAKRLKAEGVKAGVPDLFLPVPRGIFNGLFIELKRECGGTASAKQKEWLDKLARQGYCVAICHGWEKAADVIKCYLQTGGNGRVEN